MKYFGSGKSYGSAILLAGQEKLGLTAYLVGVSSGSGHRLAVVFEDEVALLRGNTAELPRLRPVHGLGLDFNPPDEILGEQEEKFVFIS